MSSKFYLITLEPTQFPEHGVEIALKHDKCSCGCKQGRIKNCTKFIVRPIGGDTWTVVNPRPSGYSHYDRVQLYESEIPNYALPVVGRIN